MRRNRALTAPGGGCAEAEPWIPALAGDDSARDVPGSVRAHSGVCLRCQAEIARYRRIVRELHTLRDQRVEPPREALIHTLRALDDHHPIRRPAAYVGGVVATAAGAAAGVGVLVWRNRRRSLAG